MVNFTYKQRKIYEKDLVFYAFLVVYFGILIFLAYKLNIWEDESYSLHTSSNDLATVIRQSYYFESQPPLYFLLLAIWRYIDSGIFFARLLSLIFIGCSAVFFYRLVRVISGPKCSRWMLIIFLLNPFTVWAGLEIRLYSLMIFLSTISIYYFFRFYIENKTRYLYFFLLISVIGIYTQYFFILEIGALSLSLLVFKGWKIFFRFCLFLIPVVILFLPNMFFVFDQVETQSANLVHTTIDRISSVLHSPQELMLAIKTVPFTFGIRLAIRIIFIFLLAYPYFKLYRKHMKLSNPYAIKINIILLTLAALIIFYCVIFSITGGYQLRYMAIVFPLFILLLTVFKEYRLTTRYFIYVMISIYYISLLVFRYKTPIKSYDFRSAAIFMNKVEYPKEPVLLYSKILLPPFSYYYMGSNSLITLPLYKFDNKYYEENINDTTELKNAIKKINSPTKSYLLMTGAIEGFKYPINMNQQTFDECLNRNFNVTIDTSFLGEKPKLTLRVRRLEIKEGTP